MTGQRQITLGETEAASIEIVLRHLELWLSSADQDVITGLAAFLYGQATASAVNQTRKLAGDMRCYHTALARALRAGGTTERTCS